MEGFAHTDLYFNGLRATWVFISIEVRALVYVVYVSRAANHDNSGIASFRFSYFSGKIYARKDLRRSPFHIRLKSAFSWVHHKFGSFQRPPYEIRHATSPVTPGTGGGITAQLFNLFSKFV